jgi:hypothetical protein
MGITGLRKKIHRQDAKAVKFFQMKTNSQNQIFLGALGVLAVKSI